MATARVVNTKIIRDLMDTVDASFALELIDTFLTDSPLLIEQMKQGIQENDAVLVHRAAHTLKSHSGTFGLDELAPLCQNLESLTAGGSIPESAPLVAADLENSYRLAQQSLAELREELGRDWSQG